MQPRLDVASTDTIRSHFPALARAGCACYTTDGEIDRLVDGVRRL